MTLIQDRPACVGCHTIEEARFEIEPDGGWFCAECLSMLRMFGRGQFASDFPAVARTMQEAAVHFALVPNCQCVGCLKWRRARA